jgi:hypothetical protein
MMQVRGYLVEAEWDGQTLTARGTNKMGQVALRGEDHWEGDVVVARSDMASIKLKPASPIFNGNLVIHTTGGKKYQLHFRRKSRAEFTELARLLQE